MDMNALQAIIQLAQQRNTQNAMSDESQALGFQTPSAKLLPFQQKQNEGAVNSLLKTAGQEQHGTQTQDSALQSVLNMISGKDTNRNSALSRMASLFM